jgi:two-component system nitrate/nitrite response regulator NarL
MHDQRGRITIVDRHQMFTELMDHTLERHGYRCHIVVREGTVSEQARRVRVSRPGVVVVNPLPNNGRDRELLRAVHDAGLRTVAVLDWNDPLRVGEAFAHGATAVVAKSAPVNEMLSVVRRTMLGAITMSRAERDRLTHQFRGHEAVHRNGVERLHQLTRQERDTLSHLMSGRNVGEIARIRTVSEHTVRTQVKAVLSKLDVSTQLQAVALAWRHGMAPGLLQAS